MGFVKAERQAMKARIVLVGPSGAGKTKSALLLAFGLVGHNGKVGLLDTSNGLAKIQSELGNFFILGMHAPFTTGKYVSVVDLAEEEGFDVLIIDSMSPAWAGVGGILEQVDKLSSKGNKSDAWSTVQPLHYELIDRLLNSKMHIIITLKAKTEYLVSDQNGRFIPKKVGLAPIQREGLDYDFHVTFDLDQTGHVALATTDHTGLFDGFADVLTEADGEKLGFWLESGTSAAATPVQSFEKAAAAEEKPTEANPAQVSDKPAEATPASGASPLFILKEQETTIKALIKETASDLKQFLGFFGVEKLAALPAARFPQAVTMLETKKGKMAEASSADTKNQPAQTDDLAEMLKARNIPFTEGDDGFLAKPAFSDNAAKAFLREQGFTWNAKAKSWGFKLAA